MPTPSPVKERRDAAALEARRKKAGRMFARDIGQPEIARRLGVSRTAVYYWYIAWKKKGQEGLKGAGRFGRKSRLTEAKIERIREALLAGPRKAGYPTDLWTLSRIAQIVKKKTGIAYHPSHLWKILRSMRFSAQIPATKPKERDENRIKVWREGIWPKIQKRGPKTKPA